MLDKLQDYTVKLYGLENEPYEIETLDRLNQFLVPNRFDLFAKLLYISLKQSDSSKARFVYLDHIRAFNPDGREPGCNNKRRLQDFVTSFETLIHDLNYYGFDSSQSLIPVDKNGVILDGSHRVATLIRYAKGATIVRFPNVEAKYSFNWQFFQKRGISNEVIALVMREMLKWKPSLRIACLWQKSGVGENVLADCCEVYATTHRKYVRSEYLQLVKAAYIGQDWAESVEGLRYKADCCFSPSNTTGFVLFDSQNVDVVELKSKVRKKYSAGTNDSIHISDGIDDTARILDFIIKNDNNVVQRRFLRTMSWQNFKDRINMFLGRK